MKKRLLSILLALCMVLALFPATAFAADIAASGYCGKEGDGTNLAWVLDRDGVLSISGTGEMADYGYGSNAAPWGKNISQVNIRSGVSSIGACAFVDCTRLESVYISESVTRIRHDAFDRCRSLENITLPNSITSLEAAFNSCTSLKSIVIPSSITTISGGSFMGCSSLTKVVIPDSVTSIGDWAFSSCTSLASVTIPKSVTNIEEAAFSSCSSLVSINVANGNPAYVSVDGILFNADQTLLHTYPAGKRGTYNIPDSVTSIENHAFYGCKNLTGVTVPVGVTSIGESVFMFCSSLSSITIPSSVTIIEMAAFWECSSLASVTIPNSVTRIELQAFYDCSSLTDVHYSGSEEQWKQINIGGENDPLRNATIHYNSGSSAPTPTPDPTESTYTHFGKLDSYDRNGSAVIDGVTYQFAAEFKNSSFNIGPMWSGDYTDNYVYALYSLDANNKITALKCNYGVICKLEGWDAANLVVDTDRLDIAGPGGSQLGLKSGDYRVSDIVKGSFPTSQIANWVGNDIRIYTDRQTIYKVIHVEHKSGTITAFDALSKPQVVYIDGKAYPIVQGDSQLIEDINNANLKYVNYTTYDSCVVEVKILSDIFELYSLTVNDVTNRTKAPTVSLNMYILGEYISGDGAIRLKDLDTDLTICEISANDLKHEAVGDNYIVYEKETDITAVSMKFENIPYNKKIYAEINGDFLVSKSSGESLKELPDKNNNYILTPADFLGFKNYDEAVPFEYYKKLYGSLLGGMGSLLNPSKNGLCWGMVAASMTFAQGYLNATDFNGALTNSVYSIEKEAFSRKLGLTMDEYIKFGYIMQFSPTYISQLMKNKDDLNSLYNAVLNYAKGNKEPVLVRVGGNNHALWAYGINVYSNYTEILVYNCNEDALLNSRMGTEKIILEGRYPNFTKWTYRGYDTISYVIDADLLYFLLSEINLSSSSKVLDLSYNLLYRGSDSIVLKDRDEKSINVNDFSDSTILPVDTLDSTSNLFWIKDGAIKECYNNGSTAADVSLITDVTSLSISLNNQDSLTFGNTTSNVQVPAEIAVNKPGTKSIVYSWLLNDEIVDVSISGWIDDNLKLTGYEDSVSLVGMTSPTITVTVGDDVLNGTVEVSDGETLAISVVEHDGKLEINTVVKDEDNWTNPFTDVSEGEYYYDAVLWAVANDITSGTSATTFSPNDPCTRAQIVTFLWRAAGSPTVNASNPFRDVAEGTYYYDAVLWAVQNGITSGTSATTFSPDKECTRAEAVTFLYRAKSSPIVSGTNSFTDVTSGAYYANAVQWAVNTGVTAGTSGTTFSPDQTCTRAQIVTFLYRDRKD